MILVSSGPGWVALALALVGGVFAVALALVRRGRWTPRGLSCAVALALVVCAETIAVNALSPFGSVTRAGIVSAHLALLAAGGALLWRLGPRARALPRLRAPAPVAAALVVPLVVLAAASALRYAPNSGDSMTYHLARVAHWIQRGTVDVYPTGTLRQNVMMPGAEYVLVSLQVVSGTDRLAALLQLGAYVVLVASAPAVARLAGAPRRLAAWAAPLTAALPMAVLQASSTQNDLVAAVLALAVITSSLRVRGSRSAPRLASDLALLAACGAAALVVKASAVVVAFPFALLALVRLLGRRRRPAPGRCAAALLAALAVAAVTVGPELARRGGAGDVARVVPVYPPLADWADRGANVVRGLFHHLPVPPGAPAWARPELTTRQPSLVAGVPQLVPHEDVVGNPLHAAAVVVAAIAAALGLRRVERRGRWAMAAAVAAWVLIQATLRDNEFVSRLQLPLFAVAPVFTSILPERWSAGRARVAVAAAVVVAVALGAAVAASNVLRPPLAARAGPAWRDYYRNDELVREPQATALRVARDTGCRRIGLFMGESGFEYPLTWGAMQAGIEVRHVFGTAAWPCLVYAEPSSFGFWRLPREPVALAPAEWLPAAANAGGVFLYRRIASGRAGAGPAPR